MLKISHTEFWKRISCQDIFYIHSACFLTITVHWRHRRKLTGVRPTNLHQQTNSSE